MENDYQMVEVTERLPMTLDDVVAQVSLIQHVMKTVMKPDEHYGTIPGTEKPTLLKPGAEKLCLTFHLEPDYEIIREVREKSFIAYTVKCTLYPMKVSGIGSCNSRETKYRYRSDNTGRPVPKDYWQDRDSSILGGPQFKPRKKDKQWLIFEMVENDNPWDLDNTLVKMACKRALVAATLNATAASDIFTQDLEDMPSSIVNGDKTSPEKPTNGPESSKSKKDEQSTTGPKKDKLTEAFLRSIEEIQKELVMSLGESEAAKAVDSALNHYEAKTFEDIKKPERGAFIVYLTSFKDKENSKT